MTRAEKDALHAYLASRPGARPVYAGDLADDTLAHVDDGPARWCACGEPVARGRRLCADCDAERRERRREEEW